MTASMRLQRFLAQSGVASRRKAEELITGGRVSVNGRIVRELGTRVDPRRDRVECNGQRVVQEDHVWLLLNKPPGTVSTVREREGRETVVDLVGDQGVRLFPVGRLDYDTQGVLLLTNDGELAHALLHPKNRVPRTYHVKVKGLLAESRLELLRRGVTIDGGQTVAGEVRLLGTTGKHTWIEITLRQGMTRQIHRMLEAIGAAVLKLTRVAFGGLTVEGLRPGEHRPLTQKEVNLLRAAVHLGRETARETPAARRRKPRRPPASRGREAGGQSAGLIARRHGARRSPRTGTGPVTARAAKAEVPGSAQQGRGKGWRSARPRGPDDAPTPPAPVEARGQRGARASGRPSGTAQKDRSREGATRARQSSMAPGKARRREDVAPGARGQVEKRGRRAGAGAAGRTQPPVPAQPRRKGSAADGTERPKAGAVDEARSSRTSRRGASVSGPSASARGRGVGGTSGDERTKSAGRGGWHQRTRRGSRSD